MENPNLREIVEECVTEPDDWASLSLTHTQTAVGKQQESSWESL